MIICGRVRPSKRIHATEEYFPEMQQAFALFRSDHSPEFAKLRLERLVRASPKTKSTDPHLPTAGRYGAPSHDKKIRPVDVKNA
jgi:hypothetical protein